MRDQNSSTNSSTHNETAANGTEAAKAPGRPRGFAAMDPALVRELARRGGVAAHRAGTAHEFSTEEARDAGRKGGLAHRSGQKPQPS